MRQVIVKGRGSVSHGTAERVDEVQESNKVLVGWVSEDYAP